MVMILPFVSIWFNQKLISFLILFKSGFSSINGFYSVIFEIYKIVAYFFGSRLNLEIN